ncbi:aspartate aminotransferase family protein [Mycobacterium sp. MS1601]|uniref:class-III pyridoxal-phosphate-dependent aminotransferase n=1 Tax=Mycobacterium sp. MS1601 TaxID=1936029 RepID=UPI000979212F|nr:aminotransferase class III-fold pyridoxal phosphate-dependent enzyme [Mycobacterium sp. MS1601]AQA05090.1 aspartate aminotransferase family protein [Mycobacterium sp. MS1601]
MAHQYGLFQYESKAEVLDKSAEYWNPAKTQFWVDSNVDLVIDRREGYFLHDMSGKRLIDMHLNGGTYNLGHRNPEIVGAVRDALEHFDVGNHHFPALARTACAEALLASAPTGLSKVMFGSGGGEAVDIALKSARHATQRRKIVSIERAYHGHTGLAVATGDRRFSELFLSDQPHDFVQVPFNDIEAMQRVLRAGDVAAVILETVPATYGFPLPLPDYLRTVKKLCEQHGSLYIADEVQTGLMRTGEMWAIQRENFVPDMIVTGKGLGGGLYPLGAVIANETSSKWLHEDGFGHMSTFGGAELGCVAALSVLNILNRPETRTTTHYIAEAFRRGLADIQADFPEFVVGVRQLGLVIGLEFAHPRGGNAVMETLYRNGIWAIFATLDNSVLQLKPGVLYDPALTEEVLSRLHTAVSEANDEFTKTHRKAS